MQTTIKSWNLKREKEGWSRQSDKRQIANFSWNAEMGRGKREKQKVKSNFRRRWRHIDYSFFLVILLLGCFWKI
jgi:hypothetical protein